MNVGLSLDWWRCPDGVEFAEVENYSGPGSSDQPKSTSTVVRMKSSAVEPIHFEVGDFRESLAVKFASAVSDKGLLRFVSDCGLPVDMSATRPPGALPAYDLAAMRLLQKHLKALLQSGRAAAETTFNRPLPLTQNFSAGASLTARMKRGEHGGTPRIMLRANSLYDFMMMEGALILSGHVEVQTCPQCGDLYVMRGAKAKRTDSIYCSPKCRVAAYRSRKAEAAERKLASTQRRLESEK